MICKIVIVSLSTLLSTLPFFLLASSSSLPPPCTTSYCTFHYDTEIHNNHTIMQFFFQANATLVADSTSLSFCDMTYTFPNDDDDDTPRQCQSQQIDSTVAGRYLSGDTVYDHELRLRRSYVATFEHGFTPNSQGVTLFIIDATSNSTNFSELSLTYEVLSDNINFFYVPPVAVLATNTTDYSRQSNATNAVFVLYKLYDNHVYYVGCADDRCTQRTKSTLFDDGSNVVINNVTYIIPLPTLESSSPDRILIPALALGATVCVCLVFAVVLVVLYRRHLRHRSLYQRINNDSQR
jgi:hypothetical protein